MPNRKAIHETPREIPGTALSGGRSQAGSRPGRRGESDWFAYKGRPAARPAPPPPKAPAPAPGAPKQTPAPDPSAPKPPEPAKPRHCFFRRHPESDHLRVAPFAAIVGVAFIQNICGTALSRLIQAIVVIALLTFPVLAQSQSTSAAPAMTLDICPSDYSSFPDDAPILTCGCSPEATKEALKSINPAYGANPYWSQSSLCGAAVHAGAITAKGGQIVVAPAGKVAFFPAVTRNGVRGASVGEGTGFKVTAAPGAAPAVATEAARTGLDASGQPIQAPVAQTLQEKGEVALYIRFRFNSADLDLSAASTLFQLRDALMGAPDMRLMLVGHTDAVGGRDYNLSLSLKRAQSVMLWLREQGITPQRLSIDGKGFDEPVAENATESGRALNRRVQAIRIP